MNGKQLKNSILQWAIQGKLVSQDPNDEPASVLLERIRAEKAKLVKEKKIKKDKNESIIYRGDDNSYYEKFIATGEVKCIDEEIPFEIPQGWEWERLGNITTIKGGKRIPVGMNLSTIDTGHKYIRVADMKNHSIKNDDIHYITDEIYEKIKAYIISKDDLYITVAGTIGNVGIVPEEFNNANLTENADKIEIYALCKLYLLYTLLSDVVQEQIRECTTKVGQPKLAIIRIQNFLIPIAPLAEQKRISNRIEVLLPIVDKYEFLSSKLVKLNSSINEFLKKSILQEAIQGKLVPQIAEEGAAQELLEQIKAEKEKLVKEGKLKKSALTNSVIYKGDDNKYYEQVSNENTDITEEIPFDLPNNWTWIRFGQYVRMSIGKTPPRGETKYWTNGIYPWVSISDMSDYGLVKTTKETVSEYVQSLFGDISSAGTLIMSFKLTVGRTSILDISAYHNEAVISIYPFVDKDYRTRNYLFYILPIISNLGDSKDAIKGKTLNSKSLNNLLLPLPPLNEQGRIVAIIEQLFDKLR
ncbi:restriction endonuclease subunit S [Paraprevotella clara]|uniref:restriction endonuclease subunit S n=1 Tax=Paraprevotella clara TaxID=454154 RepID=UPI00307702B5